MRTMSILLSTMLLSICALTHAQAAAGSIGAASESVYAALGAPAQPGGSIQAAVALRAAAAIPEAGQQPELRLAADVPHAMREQHEAKLAEFARLVEELQANGDITPAGVEALADFVRRLSAESPAEELRGLRRQDGPRDRRAGTPHHEWREQDVEWRTEGMPPDVRANIERQHATDQREHGMRMRQREGDRARRPHDDYSSARSGRQAERMRGRPGKGHRMDSGNPAMGNGHAMRGGGSDPLGCRVQAELMRLQLDMARLQGQLEMLRALHSPHGMRPGGQWHMRPGERAGWPGGRGHELHRSHIKHGRGAIEREHRGGHKREKARKRQSRRAE